jgi:diguanylate cyclase (GGDEF)-like protein
VTLPIAALAAASLAVVLSSLFIGAREVDSIALARQRETIDHALAQHGHSLARELRVQTVWTESYLKTRARDADWMRSFYGIYLNQLLGYDRIYVLAGDDTPVFGYVAADQSAADFAAIGSDLTDLLAAVRHPHKMPAYDVVTTDVPLLSGRMEHHTSVADVRAIGGRPATVVVSTIMPDRGFGGSVTDAPMLLVAVEEIDKAFTRELGDDFGFRDMHWETHGVSSNESGNVVKSINGAAVGTLAWQRERPGMEFIRRVTPGLTLSLLLIGLLTYLLILWGKRQAKHLLESEEHATLAARTDALTGLPNRVALREAFTRQLEAAQQREEKLGALSIDIDQFKSINDAFGAGIGDAVLVSAARRLRAILPRDGFLARPDGDTFVILVSHLDEARLAELAADAIAALAEPFELGGTRVFVTASVGYAISPRDGDSGDELLRRAELAVDKAKDSTQDAAVAFAPEMDAEITYRHMLETALRHAVAEGAISVVYQPLMDASGTCMLGVEALARWTDPTFGAVSPEIFIPLAEETGLIQTIGQLVLRRAVEDGKAWPQISVAVNVSASQIHHGDVVGVVRGVLEDSGFPAERLEIEITESVLLADEKRANEQMRGLQALGVRVALDDFGTGYSGLQYLRRFGFDKLKIDRSFIDGAGAPQDSSVILASIIKLGQDLDLTITAEGVETREQQRWLQAAGCHQLQGFLFSRPLPPDQITAFISANTACAAVAS